MNELKNYLKVLESEIEERKVKMDMIKSILKDVTGAKPKDAKPKDAKPKEEGKKPRKIDRTRSARVLECMRKYPGRSKNFYAKHLNMTDTSVGGALSYLVSSKKAKSTPLEPGKRTDMDRKINFGYYLI